MASKICKLSLTYYGELSHCEVCCDGAVVIHAIKVKGVRSRGPLVFSVIAGEHTISTFPGLELTVLGGKGLLFVKGKKKPFEVKPGAVISIPPNAVFTFKLDAPAQFLAKRLAGPEMNDSGDDQCTVR